MCGGIKFIFERTEDGLEQTARVFFSQPVKRKIPVIHKGKKRLIQRGRHEEETQNTVVPKTGWARLDNLDSEYWKKFKPEKVLIPALESSEKLGQTYKALMIHSTVILKLYYKGVSG